VAPGLAKPPAGRAAGRARKPAPYGALPRRPPSAASSPAFARFVMAGGRAGPDRRRGGRPRSIIATDKATGCGTRPKWPGTSVDKVVEQFKELVKKNTE